MLVCYIYISVTSIYILIILAVFLRSVAFIRLDFGEIYWTDSFGTRKEITQVIGVMSVKFQVK